MGCPRSGTTLIRDSLNLHPNLICPQETHFYRWAAPFGTGTYRHALLKSPTLKMHRSLDGIDEDIFIEILNSAKSRADLFKKYMTIYNSLNKPLATRWFDKTPQNIYGAALIMSEFPTSKLIHIVRNPADVISSLKIGKVIHIPDVIGAANQWLDAIKIMGVIQKASRKSLLQIKYEDFLSNPQDNLKKICNFVDEKYQSHYFQLNNLKKPVHNYSEILTPLERKTIKDLCSKTAEKVGYSLEII